MEKINKMPGQLFSSNNNLTGDEELFKKKEIVDKTAEVNPVSKPEEQEIIAEKKTPIAEQEAPIYKEPVLPTENTSPLETPTAQTVETPKKKIGSYDDFIKNIIEEQKDIQAAQNQQYIDREQYAKNNFRIQKWGDAFKSLVDLTGGISGAYIKERKENPYLLRALEEIRTLPKERLAQQKASNNMLLNHYLQERNREVAQDNAQAALAYKKWRDEVKDILDAEKLKINQDYKNGQLSLGAAKLKQQEAKQKADNALKKFELENKYTLSGGSATPKTHNFVLVPQSLKNPITFNLNDDQIFNLYNNLVKQGKIPEEEQFAVTEEKGERNIALRKDAVHKALSKEVKDFTTPEQANKFVNWMNNYSTQGRPDFSSTSQYHSTVQYPSTAQQNIRDNGFYTYGQIKELNNIKGALKEYVKQEFHNALPSPLYIPSEDETAFMDKFNDVIEKNTTLDNIAEMQNYIDLVIDDFIKINR